MINKIHITGGPGSGKTTLSLILSDKFNLPAYDLDIIHFKQGDDSYKEFEEPEMREKRLKKIINKNKWITEGCFHSWAWPCFEKANTIILLELGFFVSSYRIIKRFFNHKLGLEKRGKKELWKNLPRLIKWNYEFTYKRLPFIKEKLKSLKHKVIHIKKNADVEKIIKKIKK